MYRFYDLVLTNNALQINYSCKSIKIKYPNSFPKYYKLKAADASHTRDSQRAADVRINHP